MLLSFTESATLDGDLTSIWQTLTDPARWAEWDPHLDGAGMDEPFRVGAEGWTNPRNVPGKRGPFKVVAVDPGKSYETESTMPLGKMCIVNRFEEAGPGRVRITREVALHGGFVPVFKLFWYKSMRADIALTFAALEKEAARRHAAAGERAETTGGPR